MRFVWRRAQFLLISLCWLVSCTVDAPLTDLFVVPGSALMHAPDTPQPPMGLPPLADRLSSGAAAGLGRKLFFDRRLSVDSSVSCATCHVPIQGFTQYNITTPIGRSGQPLQRNAPTLYNVGYRPHLLADGGAANLAEQIWGPLLNPQEMGNHSQDDLIGRLNQLTEYQLAFTQVFGTEVTQAALEQALREFELTLASADSPFDRWYFEGDDTQMSAAAKRGFFTFMAADCEKCHQMQPGFAHFTDEGFHNTGVEGRSISPAGADAGRATATGILTDTRAFRTPTLRNIALTAPYMHNGTFENLLPVVEYYNQGGSKDPLQHELIRPLDLTADERSDLVSFLTSLTGSNVAQLSRIKP
ncbi:MAG: c-type cytochrome [Proteobacteria bacterium]|nr:c-type cytochrome [Pseudomonadota bacterium]